MTYGISIRQPDSSTRWVTSPEIITMLRRRHNETGCRRLPIAIEHIERLERRKCTYTGESFDVLSRAYGLAQAT